MWQSVGERRPSEPGFAFIKYRLAQNDWGDQRMIGLAGLDERSRAKQLMATIGVGANYVSLGYKCGAFFSFEVGAAR